MSKTLQKFEEEMEKFEYYVKELEEFEICSYMNKYRKMIEFKKYD